MNLNPNAESRPSKIGGEFESSDAARQASDFLAAEPDFESRQVKIIEPDDRAAGQKLEPEVSRIGSTLARSHLVFGIGGLVIGLLMAAALVFAGPLLTQQNPGMTFMALALISPFIGLVVGGVFSLRPDHDPLIARSRSAQDKRHWTVVFHAANGSQLQRAKSLLQQHAQGTVQTL